MALSFFLFNFVQCPCNQHIVNQHTVTYFLTYYIVRLSDVLRILISAFAVCLKALVSGPTALALASKFQALALGSKPWP